MLFMGEEWGASTPWQFFTSHPEPELARAVAEGRIGEFARMGWDPDAVPDPQDPATFRRSKLDWPELAQPEHATLLALYRELIHLRRTVPELTDARFTSLSAEFDDESGWFRLNRGTVSVVANFGETARELPRHTDILLTTSAHPELLDARSAAIIRLAETA
jgi:maltooligosyltrehalose trehalohydrolase